MPTLLLRFPGGRYHATPWGHHVNEGLVEWPPSPWRVIRALIACGYATQRWTEVPPDGRRLIEALAGSLPSYRLPQASAAHSRHYMPLGSLDKGREKTTLVFDTWADVGDGCVAVRWDVELDAEAHALFDRLTANLGYLGRSESWVEASSVGDDVELLDGDVAYPHVDGDRGGRGWEQVSVLAPEPAGVYQQWRQSSVDSVLGPFPLPEGNKKPAASLLKSRNSATAPFPVDLIDALQRDTAWWKGHGWSQPPGARRVLYWRRSDALQTGTPLRRRQPEVLPVSMMLIALTSASTAKGTLPSVERTLLQAELLHRAIISMGGRGDSLDCPEVTGRGGDGAPLKGHRHAYILPVDLDADGHLDHFIVHASMKLGAIAQESIRRVQRTFTKGGSAELNLALAGHGELVDLHGMPMPWKEGVRRVLGSAKGAAVWTSATPFVPPRFLKARGVNSLDGQIQAELKSVGLPPAARVEIVSWHDGNLRLRNFVRQRRHPAKRPPVDCVFVVRLTFDTPITGPVSLGYGAHFGLGRFEATGEGLSATIEGYDGNADAR